MYLVKQIYHSQNQVYNFILPLKLSVVSIAYNIHVYFLPSFFMQCSFSAASHHMWVHACYNVSVQDNILFFHDKMTY